MIQALQAGYVAIVHGYFTNYGHVLVVRGYKDGRYYVNDPAGRWSECFKCGYTTGDYNGGSIIGIGNAFLSSYSSEGAVGGLPTVSVSVEGQNMNFVNLPYF